MMQSTLTETIERATKMLEFLPNVIGNISFVKIDVLGHVSVQFRAIYGLEFSTTAFVMEGPPPLFKVPTSGLSGFVETQDPEQAARLFVQFIKEKTANQRWFLSKLADVAV